MYKFLFIVVLPMLLSTTMAIPRQRIPRELIMNDVDKYSHNLVWPDIKVHDSYEITARIDFTNAVEKEDGDAEDVTTMMYVHYL